MLLRQMADDDPIFSSFEKLADDYDMLAGTGAIEVLNPNFLKAGDSPEVALATIADLSDSKFVKIASKPSKFKLHAYKLGEEYDLSPIDRPIWRIFRGKIAKPLLIDKQFAEDEQWMSHILVPGDGRQAWALSYEAGSAAVTNFYLEAAQELNLTPVTTSQLHHELVLRKLKRVFAEDKDKIELLDDVERRRYKALTGQGEILKLLGDLFPASKLNRVSFPEILKFRNETQELREGFIRAINDTLREIEGDPSTAKYDKEIIESVNNLKNEFLKFENGLSTTRDKVLPALAGVIAGGSALGAAVSFMGGLSTAGVVLTSALATTSAAFLARALDLWVERRKVIREQPSSISYLTKVSKLVNT
ncbi:MAG: hypothetical protein ACRD9S_24405 [Pyrinomonadaceae bacterium]